MCFNRSRRIQNGIRIPNRTKVLIRANYHRSSHSILKKNLNTSRPSEHPPVRGETKEQTIAKALVERVFGIFGPPETLRSDQGPEFGNKVFVKQLQDVFGGLRFYRSYS